MARIILFTFLVLASGIIHGQTFEGTLTYKTEYNFEISPEMEKMGMTKEKLMDRMKSEGNWCDSLSVSYKGNNYYKYSHVTPAAWTIYKGETNKIYSFQESADSLCTVTDASFDLEEKMSGNKPAIGKTGTVIDINGLMCEEVQVVWKSGSYHYYFRPSFFVMDTALYANHIYDGWAGYLRIAHALPVRVVKSITGLGTVTLTLSSYNTEKIKDSLFYIPELISDRSLNIFKIANRELMRIKK